MVAASRRVLVVDDEEIIRQSYQLVLADAGYTVRAVGSGREALQACRSEPFDVMLADLKMPDMDGLEVTRAVAKEFPDVRVVIITGYPSRSTADEAAQLGIVGYLEKPISPERLSAATADAVAQPPARHETAAASPAAREADTGEPAAAETSASAEAGPEWAEGPDMGTLKGLALLTLAPFLGLAYVVLMPLIGFGTLLFALGSGVADRFGSTHK